MNSLLLVSLSTCTLSAAWEVTFEKQVIDKAFKTETCAVADVNRDGRLDVIAGENWYAAPDWTPHPFRAMPIEGGYADGRCDYGVDVNGDGWTDVVTVRRASAMEWLENPKGGSGKWKVHKIGDASQTKGVIFADIDGDGVGDFLGATGGPDGPVAWWKQEKDPYSPWRMTEIGKKGGSLHGLGVGDMNRDGRADALVQGGWYEAPENPLTGEWTFHPMDRGHTHHTVVYDFDGDGDQDVAAGDPHGYGLYWWEQVDEGGSPAWKQHTIDDKWSQVGTLIAADVDGDGDSDLVTGKRYYAHNGKDPGADEPALLIWYELSRRDDKASFEKHVIDDDSGVGYTATVTDIDGDGDLDVVTANRKGVHLFVQKGAPTILPLFNGKNLDGWVADESLWSVDNGELIGKTETGIKHNNFIQSKGSYDDFVLTLQVKLVPDSANSGIQFRSEPADHGEVKGYQADIGYGWWGSIYYELSPRALLNDGYKGRGQKAVVKDKWNDYVIYAVGDEMRVEINGTLCTHLFDNERKAGIFAPQIHSGGPTDVRFRNFKLRKVEQ